MQFNIPLGLYDTLVSVDFSELKVLPQIKRGPDQVMLTVDDNEVRLMQTILNEDIVVRGLIDQNEVNELGKMLYWLYDEILWQKHEALGK